jgi:hypothetical protein
VRSCTWALAGTVSNVMAMAAVMALNFMAASSPHELL